MLCVGHGPGTCLSHTGMGCVLQGCFDHGPAVAAACVDAAFDAARHSVCHSQPAVCCSGARCVFVRHKAGELSSPQLHPTPRCD